MRRRSLGYFLLAMLWVAMAAGCSSKKAASVRGSQGYTPGATAPADYSHEVHDAWGKSLISEARTWLGTPYRYGGNDRDGVDCSGLVVEVFRTVSNVKLPRTTATQKQYCTEVARNRAQIGDLFFFGPTGKGGADVSHVGLYIGSGEMIHASTSRGVIVSSVDDAYWAPRFRGVGRVAAARGGAAKTSASSVPAAQSAAEGVAAPASLPPAPRQQSAIDLLDLIINQKVDSIFSERFME